MVEKNHPAGKRSRSGSAALHDEVRDSRRRVAFTLLTGNRDAAARRAARIYSEIANRGLDFVLAERRALKNSGIDETTAPVTIGNWIQAASKVFDRKPATIRGYSGALRLIASRILALQKDDRRFSPQHAEGYRRKIDAFPLAILTPESIQAWRISYVAKAGNNPAKQTVGENFMQLADSRS